MFPFFHKTKVGNKFIHNLLEFLYLEEEEKLKDHVITTGSHQWFHTIHLKLIITNYKSKQSEHFIQYFFFLKEFQWTFACKIIIMQDMP